MKPITNEDIKVLGRIVNISTENVVADASQVWDSEQKKDQETINDSLINKTDNATTSKYGIVRLAVNASDPDNNDVVTVKTMRDYINAVVDDLVNGAPGALDTFRELADALNNNPNFYTWVTDQLALKADKADLLSLERRVTALEALRNKINQIDGILTRLATAEADIDELKACCEMAKQYMNFYTVSWNKTHGGDHVTITPSVVKAGEQTVTFTIHEGYYYNTSSGGPITSPSLIDGQYGTVTLESYADGVYTIKFSDVQSNITMNGFISKRRYNVTNNVQHTNLSNPGPVLYGNTYQSTITPAAGYQIDSITVTMNGQTVSGAYNNGAITVPNVSGPIVITGTTSETSQVGSIIVDIQHGTPSNLVFPANGVTHTATVLPDNGYTSVDPEITTNNPQVNATVSGTTVTITGTSSTNVTIHINYKPDSTPTPTPTYGTVAVSPDHGTASPASFSADGTSHTITITPASGYTTTGMTATTTNNDLTVSVSGNTITVTGTSSNNATINVTVPAESTPTPGGPATVNVVVNQYNGYGGNASPASGTATNGTFESTVTFYQSDDYRPANTFVVLTDHNGNVVAQSLPGNTTTADPSATSPDLGYMYSTGYYATLTLTGLADGEAYTANVYFIGGMDSVTFDAYGRTNDYANGRKGTLNYGGSAYQSSAGDYSTQNPFTAGYSYGEIMLPDITTLNVTGSTNQEKLANLANSLVFDFYKLDNNGTDARELGPNPYIPFSISGDSSTTQNTYVSNTNNYNIRLNGTIPVIDVVCAPFTSTTPSTDTYDTDTDGYAVIESDPIFFDNNYGTDVHLAGTTGGSRQYIADSCWTNLVYITSTLDSSIQLRVRLFRKGYAIREIDIVTSTSSGSSAQYCVYGAPLSAIDHYTYTIVDGSNNTIDSGSITVADDVNEAVVPNSVDKSQYPIHTVTITAVPKSTAQTESLVSTMTFDYSGS